MTAVLFITGFSFNERECRVKFPLNITVVVYFLATAKAPKNIRDLHTENGDISAIHVAQLTNTQTR